MDGNSPSSHYLANGRRDPPFLLPTACCLLLGYYPIRICIYVCVCVFSGGYSKVVLEIGTIRNFQPVSSVQCVAYERSIYSSSKSRTTSHHHYSPPPRTSLPPPLRSEKKVGRRGVHRPWSNGGGCSSGERPLNMHDERLDKAYLRTTYVRHYKFHATHGVLHCRCYYWFFSWYYCQNETFISGTTLQHPPTIRVPGTTSRRVILSHHHGMSLLLTVFQIAKKGLFTN